MNLNYSQEERERGYLKCRRLTPSSFFDLLMAIDVPKLLNHLGLLKGHRTQKINGRTQYYILCPFHQERSPSCWIDTVKWFFYCWGCHANWDLVKFTAEVQWKGSLHAIGTIRNLFHVKGLQYENIFTPIPEVLEDVKNLILWIIENTIKKYQADYYAEIQAYIHWNPNGWYIFPYYRGVRDVNHLRWQSYLTDFLLNNKLKELYTISKYGESIGNPSWKRDYRWQKLTKEFLKYVDRRRNAEDWENFLSENYEDNYDERDEYTRRNAENWEKFLSENFDGNREPEKYIS